MGRRVVVGEQQGVSTSWHHLAAMEINIVGDSSWRVPNKLRDEYKHPDLRKLDVPFATIGPLGMPLLAQALRFNTTLGSLSFSGSGCGDIGVETMADTLMTNTGLSSLDLGFSEIGAFLRLACRTCSL